MQPGPFPPLALALPGPAQRLLVVAVTLFATWAVARFLAVGVGHQRREAELARRVVSGAEIDAWRWTVRRHLHARWAGPQSPRAALASAPVAHLIEPRPAIGREPGLHLVVGPPGTGTSAALWGALEAMLTDPDGPVPLLVDATRLARLPPARRATPDSLHRLAADELTRLTGMPAPVADRLAGEVAVFLDGFDDLLASHPEVAADLLMAFGGRPDGTGSLHAVVALALQRNGEAAPARRIVVSTTPAGYDAFTRAGLTEADGLLATVTHLEPVDEVSLGAIIETLHPPRPGLAAALHRLPALAPLLGRPLWLDVALETFDPDPVPGLDPEAEADVLGDLPATAGPQEIAAALWDRWLELRLPRGPDTRRFAAALARRHPPRSQPTFHLHDLGARRPGARAWSEGMAVGAGATIIVALWAAAIAPTWMTVALGLLVATGVGALASRVLQRHERRTGQLGPLLQAEGTEDGDGPALAGLAIGLIVTVLVASPSLPAGAGSPVLLMLWSLLVAVPVGVTGWLAFRARLGNGGQGPALLTLGAFGGTLSVLIFTSAAAVYLSNIPYPIAGDPADLVGWCTAALIVGPLVGLVDGFGGPGSAPLRFRPAPAVGHFARSLPTLVLVPVAGSVLVSGALLLGVAVQPELASLLSVFAAGGLVIGLATWVVAGATAGFTPDPVQYPPTDPRCAVTAGLRRAVGRVALALVVTGLVAVPTGWLVGDWLSTQQLGPAQEPSLLVRQEVPMVGRVLTGVAGCMGLWLVATLATIAPLRHRLAVAVAAARGRAPRDYGAFLEELAAAGVLHRCGAGYRFRHPSLADHLAGRPALPAPGAPPADDAFDPVRPPVAV